MSNTSPTDDASDAPIFRMSMERYVKLGIITTIVLVLGVGGWAAVTKISGAVVAPGVVSVGSRVKEVQHREGGIIRAIYVDDGDHVDVGELLVTLDDTQSRASRDMVAGQLFAFRARMDRLQAERDKKDAVTFRPEIADRAEDPAVAEIINGQQGVFAARKATLAGQTSQYNEQLAQLNEQIAGLEAQRSAKEREIELVRDELVDLRQLEERDLVPRSRVVAREREAVRLEGEEGDLTARIATARGRMAEIHLLILQVEKEFQQTVLDEIEALQTEIARLTEQTVAADDELSRVELRAPVAGLVHEIEVSTVGGVIPPGGTIMKIVPDQDEMIIEAEVSPIHVDEVRTGQDADIMFSGLSMHETPRLQAKVRTVGADATRNEQTGLSFFTVRVALPESELERLGNVVLVPGMPADVFIRTRDRTVLNYLVEPLLDAANVALRES
ncbi:MAG: HlyD family type I secretion periplasmic adaptor subunit [Pseudomonadota bacterium]